MVMRLQTQFCFRGQRYEKYLYFLDWESEEQNQIAFAYCYLATVSQRVLSYKIYQTTYIAIWFATSLSATSKESGVPNGTEILLSAFGGVADNDCNMKFWAF